MITHSRRAMTSRERIEALYHRQPVDRVGFMHRGYGFCARNVGYAVADIYEHPRRSFEAQLWTFEQYGADNTPFYSFSSYGAWEFGGQVKWPDDRVATGPAIARRPVQEPDDLWKLEVGDLRNLGCIPKMIEFGRLQKAHGLPVGFICGSPFTHAANLCGVDQFLLWLLDCPEAAHRALRLVTDLNLAVARYFVDTFGAEHVMPRSAAPTESNALISPRQFEEFALPYLKELHEKVLGMGVKSIYCHICGDHNANLPLWARVPFGDPGMLSIGHEVHVLKAAETFPEHIIMGNVDTQIIARGTPDQIIEACRQVIEKGKQIRSGFVLSASCELPATTPPYHIYLMAKARDQFGWYD